MFLLFWKIPFVMKTSTKRNPLEDRQSETVSTIQNCQIKQLLASDPNKEN